MSARGFHTTRWSIVRAAADGDRDIAAAAWSELCQRYWQPLYAFARRRGLSADDAADAVQSFFAVRLERRDLAPTAAGARFRSYLLTAMQHFLANARRAQDAQKRGGGAPTLDLDAAERSYGALPVDRDTPERLYLRRWAAAVLAAALQQIAADYAARGQQELFARLLPFLDGGTSPQPQAELAAQLGIGEGAFKVAVHRARQRFRGALRDEISGTLADPRDVDDELADLLAALAD